MALKREGENEMSRIDICKTVSSVYINMQLMVDVVAPAQSSYSEHKNYGQRLIGRVCCLEVLTVVRKQSGHRNSVSDIGLGH